MVHFTTLSINLSNLICDRFYSRHIFPLNLSIQVFKSLCAEQWQDTVKSRCCEKKYISVKYAVVEPIKAFSDCGL